MSVDELITQAEHIKSSGYSSKIPVPINIFLQIARDAKSWSETPEYVRDVAKALREKA